GATDPAGGAGDAADQGAALARPDGPVRIPPCISARRAETAEAPALPASLVPPGRTRRQRAGAAPRAARLRVRLPPARHRDLPARHQLLPAERADGLARPRAVVPPPVPRRRVAAEIGRASCRERGASGVPAGSGRKTK